MTEGIRLLRQKRYRQALEAFRNGESDPGEDPELAYYVGLCHTHLDEFDQALFYLEQVVDSELGLPYQYQTRMVLGYIYAVTGRYRLAEFEFNKLLEEGFESAKEYAALGYVVYAQDRAEEAITYLEKALNIDPNNANALNSLGYILAENNMRAQEAVRLCRKACGLVPNYPAYLDSLGWAFAAAGNFEEAQKTLRRALELSPKNREIAGHLKRVMQRAEA